MILVQLPGLAPVSPYAQTPNYSKDFKKIPKSQKIYIQKKYIHVYTYK